MNPSTIKRLENLVIKCWKKNPRILTDDMELLIEAWEEQGITIPTPLKQRLLDPRLFSNESLTRMRRLLVSEGKIFKQEEKKLL